MKKLILSTLLFIFAISIFGCASKRENPKANNLNDEAVPVKVAKATMKNYDIILEYAGTVEPYQKARIGAQMSGTIEKIYVKEGDFVKEGQLLVQMNTQQLTQAKIQYELAESDYKRMKSLFETGSIPEQQLERAKATYESAKASYELMLSNTQIRAPFDGIVTEKLMNEGEVFTLVPAGGGSPGIITLMRMDVVKIKLSIAEKDFPLIKLNQPAEVYVDAYPDKVFIGKVAQKNPAVSSLSRTFTAEIEVTNPQLLLRPGMFARVRIKIGQGRGIIVPESAIVPLPGSNVNYVFIVQNETALRRNVTLGRKFDGEVEILNGVNENDFVVTSGQAKLADGTKVKIVE
ncbi:efflux RND transporter periplasmic adaptor subunit [Candidatus Chrysopegis kryptomonas]|uniref:RND family efflux transporter, MFP subunit n=1 Tax=Candidatus Chryseopegocella kryptomonas TaxID=1633643 RepID=A0A0P1MT23_9BACT|nr:efflux RND transporter periplasmic adaptor subunit [Candidatus Chrysopegis kryptomonas]CUS98597.1 RND family efflux transporter, MFP subunit [Candidatus Chrysopegis kryptomonas]